MLVPSFPRIGQIGGYTLDYGGPDNGKTKKIYTHGSEGFFLLGFSETEESPRTLTNQININDTYDLSTST